MLRRAVLTLLIGAGIPILALSYMALRSISSQRGEEQRKVEEQAQTAAQFVVKHLDEQLDHLESALEARVRDAIRSYPEDLEDELTISLESLKGAEPLVRQAFLVGGGRMVYPSTHKAPPPREPDAAERSYVADAILRAERETDTTEADRTLYYAWNGCKDPGLRAALRLAQADLRRKSGFSDDELKFLEEVRGDLDVRGLDQEPLYVTATIRYAELLDRASPLEQERALDALLELADYLAADRWHQEAGERRALLEAVLGEAERLAATSAAPDAARKLQERRRRAAFLDGFEDSILRELRAHVAYPGPGDLTGRPLRFGTVVGDRETRLLSAIGVVASSSREAAALSSARPVHRDPRLLAGADVDMDRLQVRIAAEIGTLMSTTETRLAVLDAWNHVFAGDAELRTPAAAHVVLPFAKELPGWHVLAVPRDPEGPARAAEKKRTITLALVATCALAALGSFSLALRAASREVEVAKVRTDLVRNVSHELRTPVASIQMLSEMLEDGGLPPEKQTEYFGRIAREARRLSRLIENVLDLARVERGARKVEPVPMLLGDAVSQAVELFKESEQGREANVVFADSSAGAIVPLDASTVEQIIGNLLSNAVKYSPPGAEITVGCSVAAKAVISVRDRGRGMTAEEQNRLFNPFYRARPEDAGATGVGLGLVITRELVRLHGGELAVASAPGAGTTFTITLPRGTA